MIFTENWTKEDNKIYRNLIKEGKDPCEYMSMDKLKFHPTGKYIYNFSEYLREMRSLKETDYTIEKTKRGNFVNYTCKFKSDSGNNYVMLFNADIDELSPFPNNIIYHLSFTLENNLSQNDEIFGKSTGLNEPIYIFGRLMYILKEMNTYIKSLNGYSIYVISSDNQRMKIYDNLIGNTLGMTKIEGKSSRYNNHKVFYYE